MTDITLTPPTGKPPVPEGDYVPMTTVLVLDAIKMRLADKVAHVAIDLFPERPEDYRLNHAVAALLIGYSGSQYATTSDTGMIAQQRELRVFVTVAARKLNGTTGAIGLSDQVISALQGWRAPHCQPMWLIKDSFAGETAGIWRHVVELATRTMAVQVDGSSDWPTLTQVNYEDK